MHRIYLLLIMGVVSLGLLRSSRLEASCGQAFCPIETSTTTERHPHGGELQLNFTYEFIDLDDPYVGTSSARTGESAITVAVRAARVTSAISPTRSPREKRPTQRSSAWWLRNIARALPSRMISRPSAGSP